MMTDVLPKPLKRLDFEGVLNEEEVTVKYDYEPEEPNTWEVQGTSATVEIYQIFYKGIDIFNVIAQTELIEILINQILEYHA